MMADRMAGMDLNGQGRAGPGRGMRPPPPVDDYPRPSMDSQRPGRGPPPQGFGQPGPPPHDPGYGYRDDGYGSPMSPVRDDFGPPGRSMTMPTNHGPPMDMYNEPPPPPMDPYNRPSTAQPQRPPPQRIYPDQGPPPPQGPYDDGPMSPGWGNEPPRGSFDDHNGYYDQRGSFDQYGNPMPDFNSAPQQGPRESLDRHVRPSPNTPQPGPARQPEMSRAKSQPNLREPQAAVFEMAGDMPPVPSGGFQAYNGYPAGSAGSAPPANPPGRPHVTPGPGSGHPAPIRPGLMANSMVNNMGGKPAPVRNYQGAPASAAGAQGRQPPMPQPMQPPPAANGGKDSVTVDELEHLRAVIKTDPNDQNSALVLSKKLVQAADVLVPQIPDQRARGRSRDRYLTDAHKILKKLAAAQNADAMFFFADCLGRGLFGHEPDNKEAFTLYQSAAKMGHPAAAYRTAVCCEIGNDDGGGTRKDPMKAIQWYKRAATLGDTPAMYKVGMILLKGLLGQPRNPREAVGWLKRAAERADAENPHALHELGLLYESAKPNDVILRDEPYALSLFQKAAKLGYKFSQFRLGCAYEYGLMGCPIDPRSSIHYYSEAARQEEHQSELALSGWYLTGSDGVLNQSDTEAYLWARKAAQAGLSKAEYAMGYFTEVGIGVPANMEDAKRWYWRAAGKSSHQLNLNWIVVNH